jgi:hypothetical protein
MHYQTSSSDYDHQEFDVSCQRSSSPPNSPGMSMSEQRRIEASLADLDLIKDKSKEQLNEAKRLRRLMRNREGILV